MARTVVAWVRAELARGIGILRATFSVAKLGIIFNCPRDAGPVIRQCEWAPLTTYVDHVHYLLRFWWVVFTCVLVVLVASAVEVFTKLKWFRSALP